MQREMYNNLIFCVAALLYFWRVWSSGFKFLWAGSMRTHVLQPLEIFMPASSFCGIKHVAINQ